MKTARARTSTAALIVNERILSRCTSVREGKNSKTMAASAGTQIMALSRNVIRFSR